MLAGQVTSGLPAGEVGVDHGGGEVTVALAVENDALAGREPGQEGLRAK
jgi:hypothetical protein